VRRSGRQIAWVVRALVVVAATCGMAAAQDELVERPDPPAIDDMEADANKDGLPDGWYNGRDAVLMSEGGPVGPHFVRFENKKPGRPARLSRAYGIDGRKTEAIILGLWIRPNQIQHGEREGSDPCLMFDFLGDELRMLSHVVMGPWTQSAGNGWIRVARRMAVPPGTKDAIMTVGLMGATGTLDIDGLTIDLVPVGSGETNNLIVNGDFELGDPSPASWVLEKDARRAFPGMKSPAALELGRAGSRAMSGIALRVDQFEALEISMAVRFTAGRGAEGATARIFFLDEFGRPVGGQQNARAFVRWTGSFAWRVDQARVSVPPGATRALLQIDKLDASGTIRIDDVRILGSPEAQAGTWSPYHEADDTGTWFPVAASTRIAPGSAIDVSFLVPAPAGRDGFVTVKDGHLYHGKDGRARFLGVSLLPPAAFSEPEKADALADRLARSGINLVRLGDLDTPLGPERSLIDDTQDNTRSLDTVALSRLDHLIAALKARGISVALELQGSRLFRSGDEVATPGLLPPGGGPAAKVDPKIGMLVLNTARALLDHVNPETGLALRDDPVLAWVTLAGEVSLFNMIDRLESLPTPYVGALRALSEKAPGGLTGRRLWEWVEAEHSRQMADALRADKLRVPIAGVSHWRREAEFVQAQSGPALNLIDDRIFWISPRTFASPDLRTMLWSTEGGLLGLAAAKRRADRPYVVGHWCNQTLGAWSLPTEAADMILGVYTAAAEDWDGLVRRGVFVYPVNWGEGPAGGVGGEDIYRIPEVVNGSPHIYALWPHVASLFLRSDQAGLVREHKPSELPGRNAARAVRRSVPGWDAASGRLVIDTPFTQALVGWVGREPEKLAHLEFSTDNDFAVLAATSIGPEPIESAKRLLVSAIGRVEPTGFRWVDSWRHVVADPGRAPLLQEPVRAKIVWRRKGKVRAFALDHAGERAGPATVEVLPDGQGVALVIDGRSAGFHWELVAE
jgi:hypothetical protein